MNFICRGIMCVFLSYNCAFIISEAYFSKLLSFFGCSSSRYVINEDENRSYSDYFSSNQGHKNQSSVAKCFCFCNCFNDIDMKYDEHFNRIDDENMTMSSGDVLSSNSYNQNSHLVNDNRNKFSPVVEVLSIFSCGNRVKHIHSIKPNTHVANYIKTRLVSIKSDIDNLENKDEKVVQKIQFEINDIRIFVNQIRYLLSYEEIQDITHSLNQLKF